MAGGPPSNFNDEIKNAMQSKSMTKASAKQSAAKAAAPKPKQAAQPSQPDTYAAMQQAGQAHMDAIHAHINSMKGG